MAQVMEADYPIFDHETRANPQRVYARMRQNDPVCMLLGPMSSNRIWFFTRYDDVVNVLKDGRFIKDARRHLPVDILNRLGFTEEEDPGFAAINRHLLNLDAPDHTRLRQLVHRAFTPRTISDLQPRIEAIASDLLDSMDGEPEVDLIEAFAFPLPITVIAEMLGVDVSMRDQFRQWTTALLHGVDEQAGRLAVMSFVQYVNTLIEARREHHYGDILSELVAIEDDGDSLDHMELLSMVFLLLVAGHETTVNLIGNGMLALMQHPEQQQKLAAHPEYIESAVEEMLRYNGPVETTTYRFASEDVEFDGQQIRLGDVILPSLLAANRDPAVFDDPDTFDITRNPNRHIAFGNGIHYCLGAPLARMEGRIAIDALMRRYPGISLAVDPTELTWTKTLLIHGLRGLPVRLDG